MPSSPIDTRAQRTSFVVARGPSPATFTRTKHAISPGSVGTKTVNRAAGSSPQAIQQSGSRSAPSDDRTGSTTAVTLAVTASLAGALARHSLSRITPPDRFAGGARPTLGDPLDTRWHRSARG